jgi:hypothetical protein
MQLWIWRRLHVMLPDDWELLQFSKNERVGRCAFADRYGFRFELNWRVVPGRPDFDRMLSDYESRLLEQGMEKPRRCRRSAWRGIAGLMDGRLTSRFGRFFEEISCLAELVFLWDDARDESVEHNVLNSVRVEADRDGLRRWRAFGMDLLATADLKMTRCTAEAASVEMVFGDDRGVHVERFTRRGLVSSWLSDPLDHWLRRWAGREIRAAERREERLAGHDVARLTGGRRRIGILRRPLRCDAAAWICPEDGRLYGVSRIAPATGDSHDLAGRRLACCSAMELPA